MGQLLECIRQAARRVEAKVLEASTAEAPGCQPTAAKWRPSACSISAQAIEINNFEDRTVLVGVMTRPKPKQKWFMLSDIGE